MMGLARLFHVKDGKLGSDCVHKASKKKTGMGPAGFFDVEDGKVRNEVTACSNPPRA